MIGCTIAVTCRNLRVASFELDLNNYSVADGLRRGTPLGEYIRFRLNKACAVLSPARSTTVGERVVDVVAVADLIAPYGVYLRE
jgi:hypothetical protein